MARGTAASVGDERVAQNGYLYTKTEDAWVLLHRKIVEEEILMRPLRKGERVLFKNGNRLDLRHENLHVTKVNTGLPALKRRRQDIVTRIEELQGQLADLEEEICHREHENTESKS